MKFHFTKHAKEKCLRTQQHRFLITHDTIQRTIQKPKKKEERLDGTYIVSSILDEDHILRVVYREEDDIIIVITCYPGRRKAYGI